MKRTVLLLLCLMSMVGIKAQTLVIWDAENVLQRVDLKTKPVISILDDKYVVTGDGINLEYKITEVRRFTYENQKTGVNNARTQTSIRRRGDRIVICNESSADAISLCTVAGIRVPMRLIKEGNDMVLYLNNLSTGVYLLTVNGQTTKLTKK